eukprot:92379_1
MNCIRSCCGCPFSPYIKVFVTIVLSFSALSSIYGILSKPGELKIFTDERKVTIWGDRSYNGITCDLDNPPSEYWNYKLDCNDIAKNMANNITLNPSWNCQTKLSYSNLFVFKNQIFSQIFACFVTFAFIAAFFTLIHDWRLIKHKNDISKMGETPWSPSWDVEEGPLLCYKCKCDDICDCISHKLFDHCIIFKSIKKYEHKPCIQFPLLFCCVIPYGLIIFPLLLAMGIIFLIVFPVYYLFIYPFMCCGKNEWRRFTDFNGNLCMISYLWIGLAKFGLMIVTTLLTWYGFMGFNVFIREYEPDPDYVTLYGSCKCSCHFVLPSTNFWGLMIATYLLIFNILVFLYRHAFKSMPYNMDYLISRRYIVPVGSIGIIAEKNDPTQSILYRNGGSGSNKTRGGMLKEKLIFKDDRDYELQVGGINDDVKEVESDDKRTTLNDQRRCLHLFYGSFFGCGVFWIVLYTAIGFIPFGLVNANDWPQWVSDTIMWTGIIIVSIIVLIILLIWCCNKR